MFRSIGELAFEMLAKLEIDGTATRGSNVRASGRSTAVKGSAADREGGGGQPPMQRGSMGSARAAMGMKGTASEPAAKFTGEEIKLRSEATWATISASLRTIRRNKCAAAPQGSPTLAAHLFLVIGHAASQPIA